jgi:nicotinamide riboside kinase
VECSGKTTLAARLARHYDTVWVPEFSRALAASKISNGTTGWERREFIRIALVQRRLEEAAEEQAGRLIFLDTDPFTLWVWHRLYVDKPLRELEEIAEAHRADLYLLCTPDLPWEPDGVRSDRDVRDEMHDLFIDEMERTSRAHEILSGESDERFAAAVAHVDRFLAAQATARAE